MSKPLAVAPAAAEPDSSEAAVVEVTQSSGSDVGAPAWPDESAESAFLAEARDRGEKIVAPKPPEEIAEENENAPLPPLNELVARIPAEVRDVMEDLFRARFVAVRRIPRRALKN